MTVTTLDGLQVTGAWAVHGEGPIWDRPAGMLRWVDMFRGDVLSWLPGDPQPIRWHVGDVAAALRRRRSGGYVVATARGFSMVSCKGDVVEQLPELWSDRTVRMNDGACDPRGRFYCGSMHDDALAGRGQMHRLDPDHSGALVLDGLSISNGLAFSADGRFAFLIDTPTRCVTRYVVTADGGLADPTVVIRIPEQHGDPDGMTLDAEGGFWIAMWDGFAVRHYGPDGRPKTVVRVPVSRPTACTFGGVDGRELFITSSTLGIDGGREPAAGAVFSVRVPVSGPAEELYAG